MMRAIEYKPGALLPVVGDGEEPPRIPVRVVRLDHGRLLVRLEEAAEVLRPATEAELEVPTTRALVRLFASVEQVVRVKDGLQMASLFVEDVEAVQRRKQDRFTVNFQCLFVPISEHAGRRRLAHITPRTRGQGRVSNLSTGGIQFETEYELPAGMLAHFVIRMPAGQLEFIGRIVQSVKDPLGSNSYGVKFARMDNVTTQQINRIVLQMERRARQGRAGTATVVSGGGRMRPRLAAGRTAPRRWGSRLRHWLR